MDDVDVGIGLGKDGIANGRRPRRTPSDKPCRLSTVDCRLRRSHKNAITNLTEHSGAPLEQRLPPHNDERLGHTGTKAFAAAAGRDYADDGHIGN